MNLLLVHPYPKRIVLSSGVYGEKGFLLHNEAFVGLDLTSIPALWQAIKTKVQVHSVEQMLSKQKQFQCSAHLSEIPILTSNLLTL